MRNKQVSKIEHTLEGVTVFCTDDSVYKGDIAVGADGVHSIVRYEMWRHMDLAEPGLLPVSEKTRKSTTRLEARSDFFISDVC
jgi:2-polyprenyl-6-methoxyphenol hydroxylase-like FAD-dependent oxidoreductase